MVTLAGSANVDATLIEPELLLPTKFQPVLKFNAAAIVLTANMAPNAAVLIIVLFFMVYFPTEGGVSKYSGVAAGIWGVVGAMDCTAVGVLGVSMTMSGGLGGPPGTCGGLELPLPPPHAVSDTITAKLQAVLNIVLNIFVFLDYLM